MTIPYNPNVPAANDPPTNDQPAMLQNAGSIPAIIAVDHVGFNTAGSGQHNQVTFNTTNPPGSPPVGLQSILYTNAGVAKPASAQLFWQNQDAVFHVPIRAWGFVGAGAITTVQGFNIASITKIGVGVYTVILTTGSVQSSSFGIIATSGLSGTMQTSIDAVPIGTATFQVYISTVAAVPVAVDVPWTFMVLQI